MILPLRRGSSEGRFVVYALCSRGHLPQPCAKSYRQGIGKVGEGHMSGRRERFAMGRALVLVAVALLMVGCGRAPITSDAPLEAFVAHLDAIVPASLGSHDVPGAAVAIIRGGEVVWTGAYGLADREVGRPMTADAVFHTGSISKSVSSWGAMRLVEQGQVGLDDDLVGLLREVLPGAELPDGHPITLRKVLSHTAGAGLGPIGFEYAPDGPVPSLRTALVRDLAFVRVPGTAFGYSNVGFDLVELLIEEVSGRPFAAYMEDEVVRPLGMDGASFAWREADRPRVPAGHDLRGTPVAPYVYATKASGGLFATVGDVARFVAASVSTDRRPATDVLTGTGVEMLHEPVASIGGVFGVVADAYALGHFVETLPDGRRAVWHGGQGNGWMTHFHAVPEAGDGIVILTNSQRSWPLISRVVRDWAAWSGAGAVKFGRISAGAVVVWALVVVIAAVSVWAAARLAIAVHRGRRRFAPLARAGSRWRVLQGLVGLTALAVLTWRASQPYLIETSVFPGVAGWLGWTLAALAMVLTASAAFAPCAPPRRGGRGTVAP